jgi:hypothetical protein
MAHHTDFKLDKTDPKFVVGQKVIFINDYGVNWGEKTITEHEWDDIRGNIYQYEGTDTPWFKTSERNFFAIDDIDGITTSTLVNATRQPVIKEQEKPTMPLTKEQKKITGAITDDSRRLHTDYSGRGMFGATCWAIYCDDANDVICDVGLKGARTDSMGKGSVVYWPNVTGPLPK